LIETCWQFHSIRRQEAVVQRGFSAINKNCGDIVTGDQEQAILLNTYFTSMCTAENGTNPAFDRVVGFIHYDFNIKTVLFTPGLVRAAFKK